MYSIAFVMALISLAWNAGLRWLALILETLFTLIAGLSRVGFGVHYPTELLAGWLSGLAWVLGVYDVFMPGAGVIKTSGAES
ncbi:hypothetical protein Q0M94_27405 (plasmid) [Deinococcus radiomollis]|uniref:phosphatase PAP2 family protein n=1 Tax=Deinococcus radiomollis TaxID=468916 RepID=UPI003892C20E